MSDESDETRRWFLRLTAAGTAAGLAGCGGGGGGEQTETATEPGNGGVTETQEGVPAAYETATAKDGTQRNPDGLSSKEAVEYQSQPKNNQQCTGCRFYIPDKNGDGLGACAIVAGTIDPEGWCVSYVPYQTESG